MCKISTMILKKREHTKCLIILQFTGEQRPEKRKKTEGELMCSLKIMVTHFFSLST
jgi:hypothetical protein